MLHTAGKEELETPADGIHGSMNAIQTKTAFLPDYDFKKSNEAGESEAAWGSVSAGKSLAGVLGGLMTLGVAGMLGFALRKKSRVVLEPQN
jgi:cobalt/nickel transport system permease protein